MEVRQCCPTCNYVLWNSSLGDFREPDRGILGELGNDDNEGHKSKRKQKRKKKTEEDREVGDDSNLAQPKMKDSSKWIEQYDKNYPHRPLLASAKTIVVKNQILKWQKDAPDDKIIGR